MRESGYYWIKIEEGCDWEIAEYFDDEYSGTWYFFGEDYPKYEYKDDDEKLFYEIDEKRVERT